MPLHRPASVSRRSLLRGSVIGAVAGAAAASLPVSADAATWQSLPFGDTTLNTDIWHPWYTNVSALGGPWGYVDELGRMNSALNRKRGYGGELALPENVEIRNGAMHLRMTPSSPVAGFTHTGSVVQTLSPTREYGEVRRNTGFTFSGGRLDVQAMLPGSHNGGWGSIWLMAADNSVKGDWEIDIVESGFTDAPGIPGHSTVRSTYHPTDEPSQTSAIDLGESMDVRSHTWTIDYVPNRLIRTYVDNRPIMEVTTNVATCPYFLTISNQMATWQEADWHTQLGPGETLNNDLIVTSVTCESL